MLKHGALLLGILAAGGSAAGGVLPLRAAELDTPVPAGQLTNHPVAPSGAPVVLYSNVPQGAEGVTTTGSVPRTGGADEVGFVGPAAIIESMQFGVGIFAGGPAAFDARVRIFDDVNFAAGAGQPQFVNQVAQFTIAFTGQAPGAFITAPIDLSPLPGGGVLVTSNPVNLGVPNVTDAYVQLDFFQPGTTTPVAGDLVTYLFDPSGVNAGLTLASPQLGGNGTAAEEIYWRDANANGVIAGDELRSLGAAARSNWVLRLDGTVVPEPSSVALLTLLAAGALARRRGRDTGT
jgi:hypothetical protein